MLASAEPEAMKSTAAMVALKAIGDPSAFLELNSTTEYVDMYRDCTSLPLGVYKNMDQLCAFILLPCLKCWLLIGQSDHRITTAQIFTGYCQRIHFF